LEKLRNTDYELIILDINMPLMNGKEFMKNLRENKKNIPVIALTSNSTLDDKVEMFDL
jgi:DNA-binding response OmpR family regulator